MNWPVGVGGKGNEGVAGLVTQTPGAIGYVELGLRAAEQDRYGAVQNSAGEFVKASLDSVTAAAAAAAARCRQTSACRSPTRPGGAYPISSFTWILLYENPQDKAQAKTMVDFMKWALDRRPEVRRGPRLRAAARSVVELEMAALSKIKVHSGQSMRRWLGADLGSSRARAPSRCSSSPSSPASASSCRASRCCRSSKFGLELLDRTSTWDPVAGEFGALPFIWGTLYSSILALLIAAPIALGIAVFLSELCPRVAAPAADLPHRAAGGDSVDRLRPVGHLRARARWSAQLETATPGLAASSCRCSAGPPLGVGMLSAGADPRRDGDPVHLLGGARSAEGGAARRSARRAYALGATRWEAIRAALFYARTGIIGAIMLGFGRALGETMAVTMVIGNNPQVSLSLFAPQYTMAAVHRQRVHRSRPTISTCTRSIEIGLVLFVITLVVNALSRAADLEHGPATRAREAAGRRHRRRLEAAA